MNDDGQRSRHHVVVIGGGFAGLNAAKGLRRADVDVTLVDRRNFHLFQPLTYQVATGALAPGDIAYPLRALFGSAANVRVVLGRATGFELDDRRVLLTSVAGVPTPPSISYDTLIVATGSAYWYFGHDDWATVAPEVKSLESAIAARARILAAFETAEATDDADGRQAQLTFVVVGGGPTGVEIAGQIGELARHALREDFRSIDSRDARILLVEATDRMLSSFPPSLSAKAERQLRQLGVTPMTDRMVVGIDDAGVVLQAPDGTTERIEAATVIWAAGVRASPLAGRLATLAGADVDRGGRLTVEPDLTLAGHPEVIVAGDMVRVRDAASGDPVTLPGVAPVAIQQGNYAARLIGDRIDGRPTPAFHYRDKGNLATIGRARAVADLHFVRLSGPLAWLTWLVVHLFYLIGFQNRLVVLVRWGFALFSRSRGSRLITDVEMTTGDARPPVAHDD
ncbi:MAG TPA: NAD(P)/FAD-dependent oxidoreductase [Solirubrobacteraceae bacterium]|nr:NAD(P)/FAD-dependent oxidoreductase [Solirubrobacteraceae bacterium]